MRTSTGAARCALEGLAVDLALHEAAGRRAASQSLLRGLGPREQSAVVRRAAALLAQAAEDGVRSRGDVFDTTVGGRLILKTPDGRRIPLPPGSAAGMFPEPMSGSRLARFNALVSLASRAAAGETRTEGRLRAALRAAREQLGHGETEQNQAAVVAVQSLSDPATRARLQYEATALYALRVPGRDARDVVPGAAGFAVSAALEAVEGEYSPAMRTLMGERRKNPDPGQLYREARTAELRALEAFDQSEGFTRGMADLRRAFNETWRRGATAAETDRSFAAVRFQWDSIRRFNETGAAEAKRAGELYAALAALYPGWTPTPDITVALHAPREPSAEQRKNRIMQDMMVTAAFMMPGALSALSPMPGARGAGTRVRMWGPATAADIALLESAALRAAALQAARAEIAAGGAAAARSSAARAYLNQALDAFAARFAAIRQQAAAASRGGPAEAQAARALESRAVTAQAGALRAAETEASAALRLAAENAETYQAARAAAEGARTRAWAETRLAADAAAKAAASGAPRDAMFARSLETAARNAHARAAQAEALLVGRPEAAAQAAQAAAQAESVALDAIAVGRGGVPTVRGGTGETVVMPRGAIMDPVQGPRLLRLVDVARSADTGRGTLAERLTAALRAARSQPGFTREEQIKAAVLAVHGASDQAGRARLETEAARMVGLFEPSRRAPMTAAETEATAIGQALRATETGAPAAAPGPAAAMQAAAREAAVLRMRAQGAASAAATAEQKVAAAMREMSRSQYLTAEEQFRAALESAARVADRATADRLSAAVRALEAGQPVDAALLDLWRGAGGAQFKATPALPAVPLSPVSVPAPAPAPRAALPTAEEAARLFAPTRARPAALTPWATLRTRSESIEAATWQQIVGAGVRRHAANPERMVLEAMSMMRGRPNMTAEEQFRAAVQAAYEVADEATRLRIRAEMQARNVGAAPGLRFPLLDLWRRAGGEPLPTITVPGIQTAPSPAPFVPYRAPAPAPTGAAPYYTPFGVLPPATGETAAAPPPDEETAPAPYGMTGARVPVGRAELRGILDSILGAAA